MNLFQLSFNLKKPGNSINRNIFTFLIRNFEYYAEKVYKSNLLRIVKFLFEFDVILLHFICIYFGT